MCPFRISFPLDDFPSLFLTEEKRKRKTVLANTFFVLFVLWGEKNTLSCWAEKRLSILSTENKKNKKKKTKKYCQ